MSIIEFFSRKHRAARTPLEVETVTDFEFCFHEFYLVASPEDFQVMCQLYGIDLTAEEDGELAILAWSHDWGY